MVTNFQSKNVYSFKTFGSRALIRYLLVEHRASLMAALATVGLTAEELLMSNRVLSGAEQAPIWGLASQLKPANPLIAFKAALLHDIHDSGLPGVIARSCSSVRELIEIHEKYLSKLDSEGVLSQISMTNDSVSYYFVALAQYPPVIQEYALATTWMALTALSPKARNYMLAMEFPGSIDAHGLAPELLDAIVADFGIQLSFNSGRLALVLRKSFVDMPIPTVDPALRLMLERKLRVLIGETLPEDGEELRSQVLAAILELRAHEQAISLESVSDFIGVKSEKLSYALRSHGISFQKLKSILE